VRWGVDQSRKEGNLPLSFYLRKGLYQVLQRGKTKEDLKIRPGRSGPIGGVPQDYGRRRDCTGARTVLSCNKHEGRSKELKTPLRTSRRAKSKAEGGTREDFINHVCVRHTNTDSLSGREAGRIERRGEVRVQESKSRKHKIAPRSLTIGKGKHLLQSHSTAGSAEV